ncbi:MAG: hypothetical protein ACR2LI_04345 [Propionibacteriaceae bacterium]
MIGEYLGMEQSLRAVAHALELSGAWVDPGVSGRPGGSHPPRQAAAGITVRRAAIDLGPTPSATARASSA